MTAPDPENRPRQRRSPRAKDAASLELQQAALVEHLVRAHLQLERWRLAIYGLDSLLRRLVPLTPLILGAMLILRTSPTDAARPATELEAAVASTCACFRCGDLPPSGPGPSGELLPLHEKP